MGMEWSDSSILLAAAVWSRQSCLLLCFGEERRGNKDYSLSFTQWKDPSPAVPALTVADRIVCLSRCRFSAVTAGIPAGIGADRISLTARKN
jgi:hypothetical protein